MESKEEKKNGPNHWINENVLRDRYPEKKETQTIYLKHRIKSKSKIEILRLVFLAYGSFVFRVLIWTRMRSTK